MPRTHTLPELVIVGASYSPKQIKRRITESNVTTESRFNVRYLFNFRVEEVSYLSFYYVFILDTIRSNLNETSL